MSFQDKGFFRRKYPRRQFIRTIGILVGGKYFLVNAGEIGEGGMSFEHDSAIDSGLQIVINMQIPSGDFISIQAEVKSNRLKDKNKKSHQHGVAFKNIQFIHKRQIRLFVSAREEREPLI